MGKAKKFKSISIVRDMSEKTVPFEAQRQTKSIVYFGKNTLPNWAWRGRIVANPWLLAKWLALSRTTQETRFLTIGSCLSNKVASGSWAYRRVEHWTVPSAIL